MRQVASGIALALGLVLGAGACGGEESSRQPAAETDRPATGPAGREQAQEPPAETGSASAASREELAARGRELFLERCATCHGENGDGQGPGSAGLDPKPRDFRDPAWQESVTDQHIEQVIAYGGAAVGLSPIMPAHPDLANDPKKLAALRTYVRSLGQ